jgi:hypothetical protein
VVRIEMETEALGDRDIFDGGREEFGRPRRQISARRIDKGKVPGQVIAGIKRRTSIEPPDENAIWCFPAPRESVLPRRIVAVETDEEPVKPVSTAQFPQSCGIHIRVIPEFLR